MNLRSNEDYVDILIEQTHKIELAKSILYSNIDEKIPFVVVELPANDLQSYQINSRSENQLAIRHANYDEDTLKLKNYSMAISMIYFYNQETNEKNFCDNDIHSLQYIAQYGTKQQLEQITEYLKTTNRLDTLKLAEEYKLKYTLEYKQNYLYPPNFFNEINCQIEVSLRMNELFDLLKQQDISFNESAKVLAEVKFPQPTFYDVNNPQIIPKRCLNLVITRKNICIIGSDGLNYDEQGNLPFNYQKQAQTVINFKSIFEALDYLEDVSKIEQLSFEMINQPLCQKVLNIEQNILPNVLKNNPINDGVYIALSNTGTNIIEQNTINFVKNKTGIGIGKNLPKNFDFNNPVSVHKEFKTFPNLTSAFNDFVRECSVQLQRPNSLFILNNQFELQNKLNEELRMMMNIPKQSNSPKVAMT